MRRTWEDIETLEAQTRTEKDGFNYEKHFTPASPNLEILKAVSENSLVILPYQDVMLTYVLMDSPPSLQTLAGEIALGADSETSLRFKPWEEIKKSWYTLGKTPEFFRSNDHLSDDDDLNLLFLSIIHQDMYLKQPGLTYKTPAEFIEAFQNRLMRSVVFKPGMFAHNKLQQMQSLVLTTLGDLPPNNKRKEENHAVKTALFLRHLEAQDPALHYLAEMLCTEKTGEEPITIEVFEWMYNNHHLNGLVKACTYPLNNSSVKIRMINISPNIFRQNYRFLLLQCQECLQRDSIEIYRTRQLFKVM